MHISFVGKTRKLGAVVILAQLSCLAEPLHRPWHR